MDENVTLKGGKALLAIDTTTSVCSLALLTEEGVIAERTDREANAHAARIAPFAEELMEVAKGEGLEIAGIALSNGPGSYTGLRIGAAFAKGYAFATGLPIVAISTLESLVSGFVSVHELPSEALIIPMVDAGRMEVYTAVYSVTRELLVPPHAAIITGDSFQELNPEVPKYFVGNGAPKCEGTIALSHATFSDWECCARHLRVPAFERLTRGEWADIAYWEPDYIKPYNAIIAKNKVLLR